MTMNPFVVSKRPRGALGYRSGLENNHAGADGPLADATIPRRRAEGASESVSAARHDAGALTWAVAARGVLAVAVARSPRALRDTAFRRHDDRFDLGPTREAFADTVFKLLPWCFRESFLDSLVLSLHPCPPCQWLLKATVKLAPHSHEPCVKGCSREQSPQII